MKKSSNKFSYAVFMLMLLLISVSSINAQTTAPKKEAKVQAEACDGIVVAGYVDNGAYINFTGPHIKWVKKPFAILLGVLPSLRIKEDKVATGATKNSVITPTLGAGITFAFKHLVIQVPVYYNPKTAIANGKWNPGIGIGYRF